jgi:D-glycero-D-manno-heptose 1,7-bisphosphate phosphatase
MNRHKALFIDRDGTLILEKEYLRDPGQVQFIPGAIQALKKAAEAGFIIVMVTNQSGVGRGYFTLEDVERVHAHVAKEIALHNVAFVKIYVAPESPDAPSRGRKPSPQFLFDARDEFDIDLSRSYMVGDKLIDLQCGWNADVRRSILVRTGYGRKVEEQEKEKLAEAIVVDDLGAAVDWVLRDSASENRAEKQHADKANH